MLLVRFLEVAKVAHARHQLENLEGVLDVCGTIPIHGVLKLEDRPPSVDVREHVVLRAVHLVAPGNLIGPL